ncbi:putative nucleic acid-binding protein [Prosthecobacter fusiformis]|uniref:Putative nucleic acid-binding protein n=1 Tax=Prosthecobacter fusiformis TaxID=48464 RepID=A0A4R7S4L0_9BACT|nr:PIN domain-containing protein [Prosthecobacter fusiformis]TDU72789.1 putative nucleic acid-binding protein [Prosthecobacter fusiformis]
MSAFIDTSVLVAAIVSGEAYHKECDALMDRESLGMYSHGLAEAFSTLTGGRKGFRMSPLFAAELIETDYMPFLSITTLTPSELLRLMREAESRGVRGGGIFDYMHLVAARKAKATRFYTLNESHFRAFYRAGDPQILHP